MTLGALDLLEGLNVFVLGAVHDGEDLRDEVRFVTGPVAARACVEWFQGFPLGCAYEGIGPNV